MDTYSDICFGTLWIMTRGSKCQWRGTKCQKTMPDQISIDWTWTRHFFEASIKASRSLKQNSLNKEPFGAKVAVPEEVYKFSYPFACHFCRARCLPAAAAPCFHFFPLLVKLPWIAAAAPEQPGEGFSPLRIYPAPPDGLADVLPLRPLPVGEQVPAAAGEAALLHLFPRPWRERLRQGLRVLWRGGAGRGGSARAGAEGRRRWPGGIRAVRVGAIRCQAPEPGPATAPEQQHASEVARWPRAPTAAAPRQGENPAILLLPP